MNTEAANVILDAQKRYKDLLDAVSSACPTCAEDVPPPLNPEVEPRIVATIRGRIDRDVLLPLA